MDLPVFSGIDDAIGYPEHRAMLVLLWSHLNSVKKFIFFFFFGGRRICVLKLHKSYLDLGCICFHTKKAILNQKTIFFLPLFLQKQKSIIYTNAICKEIVIKNLNLNLLTGATKKSIT